MDNVQYDFNPLSEDQIGVLNDEQKAIFQSMNPEDRSFFASSFSAKDLPTAIDRKGQILKRNQSQRQKIQALQQRLAQAEASFASQTASSQSPLGLGEIAAGAAAALGIGVIGAAVSTDGTASWKGVPPRVLSRVLEREFDDGTTTDIEVEGTDNDLSATIYLRPPQGSYVPALTVDLLQVQETTQVRISDLTSQSFMETAKAGSRRLLELAGKGLNFWLRRNVGDAISLAKSAVDTAFDAAQVAKDLNLEDRAWKVIKEQADAHEKAYKIESERERQIRLDLEDAWDDYNRCPRCAEPYPADAKECRICGRGRNALPSLPDPRVAQSS